MSYKYNRTCDVRTTKKGILVAFGELFLKSKGVRKLFTKKLIWNLQHFLKRENIEFKIHLFHDRIFLEIFSQSKKAKNIIKRIFGISWFGECFTVENANLEKLLDFIKENYANWIKKEETYGIKLKADSIFGKKEAIIDKIANLIKRKVDLTNPDKEISVEFKKAGAFVYLRKEKGAGGLPMGSSGKVLTLISGGIDSPVAAYLALKRGAENIWLHFHSFPLVSNKSIEKTKELAKEFLNFQPKIKIYFVPFQKAQIEVKTKIPPEFRILIYRRLMFKIAEIIAEKEDCLALLTGESLGQVSSQTLPNIKIIEQVIKLPILRPLISYDKEEIINLAKKIGTYNISIKPQEDCCILFVPKHSSAKGDIKKIKELEKNLDILRIVKEAVGDAKAELCC